MKKIILTFLILALWTVPAFATEKILYPNANGTNQAFIPNTGTDHYVLVDDICGSPDGDATYLYQQADYVVSYLETEALDNCSVADSIPDNAVFDSVKIHLNVKWAVAGDPGVLFAYIRWASIGAEYFSFDIATNYVDVLKKSTKTMTAVTKTELNGTEAGLKLDIYTEFQGTIRFTQAHLHIWYHQPAAGGRGHPVTRDDEDNRGILEGGITR